MTLPIDPKLAISQALGPSLASPPGRPDPAALRQACQQFEAIFTQALFKSMRATVPDGGLIEKGLDHQIFEELMDAELARQAATTQGSGIAEALLRQLGGGQEAEPAKRGIGEAAQNQGQKP